MLITLTPIGVPFRDIRGTEWKMKKLWWMLTFVSVTVAIVAAETSTLFSLPETWESINDIVSAITTPLAPTQVSALGGGMLVSGLLLLIFALVVAYRQIQKSGAVDEASLAELAKLGLNREQVLVLEPLLNRGLETRKKQPSRKWLAAAVVMVAVAVAMILQGSRELEVSQSPRLGIADNQAIAKAPTKGRGPLHRSEKGGERGGSKPKAGQGVLGASRSEASKGGGEEAFKSSECGCSSLPYEGEGYEPSLEEPDWEEPEPDWEEPEPEWEEPEPEWE
ncbi:MAG TPA: hypothetical protein VFX35_06175 [Solirubrobacterales bacterium]|nr:hypothetical protein [Solirubrobacterales bacterium]